ncbi:blastula protease 10-like [Styela clava]
MFRIQYKYISLFLVFFSSLMINGKKNCPRVPHDCEEKCVKYEWDKARKCSTCSCELQDGLFELDIMLDLETENIVKDLLNNKKKAGGANQRKWLMNKNGDKWEIPYVIDQRLLPVATDAIARAIADFHSYTCLRFVPRNQEEKFIQFFVSRGCWSYVGVRSSGVNLLSIGTGCEQKGVVIHELMHAIGFWHEQSRPDRDNHITIVWENIRTGKENNFQKMLNIESYGFPYDTYSVMHYKQTAFSRNGKPTIVNTDGSPFIEFQHEGFTVSDVNQINAMYQCNASVYGMATTASITTEESITDSASKTTFVPPTTESENEPGSTTQKTMLRSTTVDEGEPDLTTMTDLHTTIKETTDSQLFTTAHPTTVPEQTTDLFTTGAATTTVPCIDLWNLKKCKKMKNKSRCSKENVIPNCRKTCEICV